ncbi:hypothetical protein Tco_0287400 [Tanacetum coccineum]
MHTTMVLEQVKTQKIQAEVQVSRPEDKDVIFSFESALEDFILLYFVLVRNIVRDSLIREPAHSRIGIHLEPRALSQDSRINAASINASRSLKDVEMEVDDEAELIFPYEVKFDKTPPPGNVSSDFVSSDSVSSDSESETESRRSSRELEVKWFSCRAKIALLKSNNKVEGIREWGECHVEKKLVERCSHGDGSLLTAVSKPAGSDDVDYRASRQESRNLLLIGTDGSSEHMERPRTLCRLVSLLVSFEITELNDRHQLVEQPPDLGIALIIASHVLDSLDFGKGYGYSSMRSTAKWSSNKSNSCREGKEGSGVKKGRGRKERGEEEGRKMEEGGEGGRRGNRRREVGGRGEGDGRSGGEGEGRGKGVRGRREGKEG